MALIPALSTPLDGKFGPQRVTKILNYPNLMRQLNRNNKNAQGIAESTLGVRSSPEIPCIFTGSLTAENPAERRLEELRRLPFQVSAISPWHYRVGSLHIWIHAGRWWNEATNIHGSLRTVSIEALAISEWNRQLECLISQLCEGEQYSDAWGDSIG